MSMKKRLFSFKWKLVLIVPMLLILFVSPANAASANLVDTIHATVKGALPCIGKPKILVFYTTFTGGDPKWSKTIEELEDFFFSPELKYTTDSSLAYSKADSLRSYYYRSSYGKVDIQGDVFEYQTKYDTSHYTDLNMVLDEIIEHYRNTINWDNYDSNNDGYIDGVYVIPRTYHSWESGSFVGTYSNTVGNKRIAKGCFLNAESLTTACHETCHMFGPADMYWGVGVNPNGINTHCIMESELGDLPGITKFVLGWIDYPNFISGYGTKKLTLPSYSTDSEIAIIYPNGDSDNDNWFILEYVTNASNNRFNGIRIWRSNMNLDEYYNIRDAENAIGMPSSPYNYLVALGLNDAYNYYYQTGESITPDTFPSTAYGKSYVYEEGNKFISEYAYSGISVSVESMSAYEAELIITIDEFPEPDTVPADISFITEDTADDFTTDGTRAQFALIKSDVEMKLNGSIFLQHKSSGEKIPVEAELNASSNELYLYIARDYLNNVHLNEAYLLNILDCVSSYANSELAFQDFNGEVILEYLPISSDDPSDNLENAIEWGYCGFSVKWALFEGGLFKIFGEGAMDNYSLYNDQPWSHLRNSIQRIVIEEGVTSIGDCAFHSYSGVQSVTVASTVTSISFSAFDGCNNLEKVVAYCGMGDNNYEIRKLIHNGMTKIKTAGPIGSGCDYEFTCGDTLPDSAFCILTNIEEFILPDNLVTIGAAAFSQCSSLKKITLPESLTTIERIAFNMCESLEEITIPDGVTSIENSTFSNCTSLKKVVLPDQITSIASYAFENCTSLESLTLGKSVVNLGITAFKGCTNLKHLVLHCPLDEDSFGFRNVAFNSGILNNIKTIGPIGSGCNLEFTCTEKLPDHEFDSMSVLEQVIIPEGVKTIGDSAFRDNVTLKSVTLASSISDISYGAFWGCSGIEKLILPKNVSTIGRYAFRDCTSLKEIIFSGNLPEIDGIAFIGTTAKAFYSACNLSWTQAALQNYGGTLSWSSSDDYHAEVIIEAVPATCTENGLTEGSICSTCGKVLVAQETIPAMGHSIHFEQNVYETKVGSTPISIGVIADCGHTIDINVSTSEELELLASASAITSFSAKMCGIASVTVETADTFKTKADCKVIVHADNQLVMPEELKSIKAGSFAGLEAEEILLNDMVQEIGSRAFADCSTLRLINLPDEVQIANDAFDGCNQVTIICSSGSAGQFYAETNNIPYIIR